ncbi:MAG: helix-turn-helix transcriptional regulator [Lachnospiraceae bacterium]|nr:helix-turn-helix transcriptional regulator [Lachnospiraceae bacterium]
MPTLDARRVYNTLQNLVNLEISYIEYSQQPRDFSEYQTYLDYFNNYVLRSKDLYRFYFPISLNGKELPKYISDMGDVTDVLNILTGFDFSVSKLFNFPNALRHKCNYYSLIYQMAGDAHLILDCGEFDLGAGDFYLIPPEVYYSIQTSLEGLCICFNLRRSYMAAEYKSIALENPELTQFIVDSLSPGTSAQYAAIHTNGNDAVNELVLNIFAEYINQDEYSNFSMHSYLSLLFAAALRSPNTRLDSSSKVTRMDKQFHLIENYLKKNYQTANLTELSDTIHFSKQYICRIVKEKAGETFNSLLIRTRLQMVVQYLLETELPLEEIAYLCGFSAASHMSRTFKNEYGMTPSAYRNKKKTLPTA